MNRWKAVTGTLNNDTECEWIVINLIQKRNAL